MPKPEIPLKIKKSCTLNVDVIYPSVTPTFRYKEKAPSPPVISFGWNEEEIISSKSVQSASVREEEIISSKSVSSASARSAFMWQGMSGVYVAYICLSKAIRIFQKYGQRQVSGLDLWFIAL